MEMLSSQLSWWSSSLVFELFGPPVSYILNKSAPCYFNLKKRHETDFN